MICQQLTSERFGFVLRFSIAASFVSSISLATDHHYPVPRSTPVPAGSGRAQTLPHWLLPDTDPRFVKDRTGSNLDERLLYIQYVTEPGDSCGKINPFLPARCRPTIEHSLAAGDAQRQWLQAPTGWPSAAMSVLSLISPSSPKQLGMVSPELPSSFFAEKRTDTNNPPR
jgi:hypothetical protein